jgi:release factor glutamine methyltransferase
MPTTDNSIKALLAKGRAALKHFDNPALEARLLLQWVSGFSHADIILQDKETLSTKQTDEYHKLLSRRKSGTPLDAITGEREFWSLSFKVNHHVLTPRPDSEVLIATALEIFDKKPPKTILDIGTGSGCLAISLLKEFPDATAIAIDLSLEALAMAKENAKRHGVEDRLTLKQHDFKEPLADSLAGPFDLIISNPPYIAEAETLPEEVKSHDPALALFAGRDGLSAYEAIFKWCFLALTPKGAALFEIGATQRKPVTEMMARICKTQQINGKIISKQDLAARDRLIGLIGL